MNLGLDQNILQILNAFADFVSSTWSIPHFSSQILYTFGVLCPESPEASKHELQINLEVGEVNGEVNPNGVPLDNVVPIADLM